MVDIGGANPTSSLQTLKIIIELDCAVAMDLLTQDNADTGYYETLIQDLVAVVLFFTILKPKNPKVITQAVTLESIRWGIPLQLNVSLGVEVTVDNPNYGSFKYENSTVYISYRGSIVAEAPITEDTIPAHRKHDVGTTVEIMADKLIPDAHFREDFAAGCLNFTSSTTLHGKATVLKLFKIKATTYSICDVSLFLIAQNATSVCRTKIKY
ncbi:hypothetical protein F0562_014301 [Nyssa sinensis]|uniref:Late embryogenesis abundant protein LEA-2 subgroup domain-containing protein n=1 Tax=Nyssa sinensis TaxID=561372 RepID=A0A5J4ZMZ9_9ASTE|nr:hypothetical protein F0562_014301 [Nyssa sinensis]